MGQRDRDDRHPVRAGRALQPGRRLRRLRRGDQGRGRARGRADGRRRPARAADIAPEETVALGGENPYAAAADDWAARLTSSRKPPRPRKRPPSACTTSPWRSRSAASRPRRTSSSSSRPRPSQLTVRPGRPDHRRRRGRAADPAGLRVLRGRSRPRRRRRGRRLAQARTARTTSSSSTTPPTSSAIWPTRWPKPSRTWTNRPEEARAKARTRTKSRRGRGEEPKRRPRTRAGEEGRSGRRRRTTSRR